MNPATDPAIELIPVEGLDDEPVLLFDQLYHREYHAMVCMAIALVDYPEKAEVAGIDATGSTVPTTTFAP